MFIESVSIVISIATLAGVLKYKYDEYKAQTGTNNVISFITQSAEKNDYPERPAA